jgi:hypothetical protein
MLSLEDMSSSSRLMLAASQLLPSVLAVDDAPSPRITASEPASSPVVPVPVPVRSELSELTPPARLGML